METRETVPENAPEAVSESKNYNFLEKHAPNSPPPSVHVLIHRASPLFHKYSFCAPLDQFLNEGRMCSIFIRLIGGYLI